MAKVENDGSESVTSGVESLSLASTEDTTQNIGSSPSAKTSNKISILLKAAGNAPIMKQKRWVLDQDKEISWVMAFMRKYLHVSDSESLFLYVNQSFAPSPDQILKNLYDCFGNDGQLILHYCKTQAWG